MKTGIIVVISIVVAIIAALASRSALQTRQLKQQLNGHLAECTSVLAESLRFKVTPDTKVSTDEIRLQHNRRMLALARPFEALRARLLERSAQANDALVIQAVSYCTQSKVLMEGWHGVAEVQAELNLVTDAEIRKAAEKMYLDSRQKLARAEVEFQGAREKTVELLGERAVLDQAMMSQLAAR